MPRILRSPGSKSFRLENVSVPNAGGATSQAWAQYERRPPTEAAFGMTGALGGVEPLWDRVSQLSAQISIDGCVIYVKGVPKAHPAMRDELGNRSFIVRGMQKLAIALETLKSVGRPPKLVWSLRSQRGSPR